MATALLATLMAQSSPTRGACRSPTSSTKLADEEINRT